MHAPSADERLLALQEALAGRYSIERELGRGGMGVVYLAQDVRLDRPVALKLLPPEFAAQPAFRERFLREARTAAKLSHPHIVPIHVVDEVDGFVFFVMAFVEGETLGERVRRRGPVAPGEASRILREVAWALSYAHGKGVVHRDVKPDNILLEAGSGRAMVTDFGIAFVGESGLTSAGEILGTPEYMSPEQASGEEVDGRSDIYALGVVGHYMLSGRLPFQGPTARATLAKQLTQPAPALAEVAPDAPGSLGDAVDRCLAKDPGERFQDGEEVAAAVAQVLHARKEVPAAIRAFIERNREASSAIVGFTVALSMMVAMVVAVILSSERAPTLTELFGMFVVPTALAAVPFAMLGLTARRLLRSGYGHDEMVRALRGDVEERRRALASETSPEGGAVDAWAPRVAAVGAALFLVPIVLVMMGVADPALGGLLFGLSVTGIFLGLGGGIVSAARHGLRKAVSGERWLKLWESPLGRAIFGVSGLGVDRALPGSGGSYRPTEIVIGMAAERLFEELPTEVRKSLGDLPGVVGALEDHAEKMRARLRELDGALLAVDEHGDLDAGVTERRGAVAGELQEARDAAETRLRDVVAALEKLRLELLRLHAGSGTVESVTRDLTAARVLAGDMEALVEARGEVAKFLEDPLDTPDPPTPVPA